MISFFHVLLSLALAGVNVNSASVSEIETLPGIGPTKAQAIVDYREANGPFTSMADLDKVPGIGPSTLTSLEGAVEFGPAAGGAAAPKPEAAPKEEGKAESKPEKSKSSAAKEEAPAPAPAASSGGKVNINTATVAQLQNLPGIGPAKAQAIVDDREAKGPFASCNDLDRVNGIGSATIATLMDTCTVN